MSVLDPAWIDAGKTAGDAIRDAIELAKVCDGLGYGRYWLVEHHSSPDMASAAPSTMVGAIAAATARIRVGSGGVMLPNHSPLVVAEQFGTLAHLFPGRIDLGVGRAPGTDPVTAAALRRPAVVDEDFFGTQLDDLYRYFFEPQAMPSSATPARGADLQHWILGTGSGGARHAARHGKAFAFAHHIKPDRMADAIRQYRSEFMPSAQLDRPYVMVSVMAMVMPTIASARSAVLPAFVKTFRDRGGRSTQYPTPSEAEEFQFSEADAAELNDLHRTELIGDGATVAERLRQLTDSADIDELMFTCPARDLPTRITNYMELADILGQ